MGAGSPASAPLPPPAALARAVVLIEALDHSHVLRTVQAALELHRPLLAPPPVEGDVRSDGTGRLIAEHRAVLCADPTRALALL